MGGFKKISSILFTKKAFKKAIAYGLLILCLYIFKDFLGIFLLTFIFSYLFFSLACFFQKKMKDYSKKNKKFSFLSIIPLWIIVLLEYLVFIGIIIYLVSNIIPTIKTEVTSIVDEFSIISEEEVFWEKYWIIDEELAQKYWRPESGSKKIIRWVNDFKSSILQKLILIDPEDNLKLTEYIENFWKDIDIKAFSWWVVTNLSVLGNSILKILLALVLSFIFIVDRKKLWTYLHKVKSSNFSFLYKEYDLLLEKVVKSFWLILKAQSMIALANSILTVIGLMIIGFIFGNESIPTFPYILTLWLVVFVFGYVPVLWVVLSSIPIMLVAYISYWDPMVLVTIVMLIIIIHMIEAYYLNPKIVSSFLEVPVSLTFIILIISEHFFWLAWLLVWISLFYFSLWLLQDFNDMLEKKKKKKLIKK